MDEKPPGLRKARKPDWKGGAFGKVLSGGRISAGEEIVREVAQEE